MKTIYSILYVTLNASLDEKVSIGVVMSNNNEQYFKFSNNKLLFLKNVLDSEKYNFIRKYLVSIEKNLTDESYSRNSLFYNKSFRSEWVSEGYIYYLSNYSNNIIQFSKPKSINIDLNEFTFKKVFEKYIFKYDEIIQQNKDISVLTKVREYLFPKIKNKVNLEITLTASNFDNLFAPIEVDFLGMNSKPLAGQTVDFDKKHYYLENDITRFVSLTKAIELDGNKRGQYYIIGREPKKKDDKNHLLWEQIRDSNFLDFVDIDDYGIVEEYIESHDVKPFYEEGLVKAK